MQSCDTFIVFCIISCTHSAGRPASSAISTVHPIHLFNSFAALVTCGWKLRSTTSICDQASPDWYAALLVCLISATFVKESLSIVRPFLVNNCWRALCTECSLPVRSYSNSSTVVEWVTHMWVYTGSSPIGADHRKELISALSCSLNGVKFKKKKKKKKSF